MNGSYMASGTWLRRAVATVAVVTAAGASEHGRAGEPLPITRMYGAGVHAYFSGDYLRSYDDLTATIEAGSQDPRPRYFRGLAALSLGRLDEAEADFSKGADLEAQAGGDWPVSRSLERVQGHQRFQLERHRARARVAVMQRADEMNAARYGATEAAPTGVQRGRRPAELPSGAGESTNPFAAEAGAGSTTAERPATPEPMPSPANPEPAPVMPGAEEGPAAGGTDLESEMEQPAGESTGGAVESPPSDGSPVELPVDGGTAPGAAPADEPLEAGGTVAPATPPVGEDPVMPPAGGEAPFGDNPPQPGGAPAGGGE